jgi:hypothetical protein
MRVASFIVLSGEYPIALANVQIVSELPGKRILALLCEKCSAGNQKAG